MSTTAIRIREPRALTAERRGFGYKLRRLFPAAGGYFSLTIKLRIVLPFAVQNERDDDRIDASLMIEQFGNPYPSRRP